MKILFLLLTLLFSLSGFADCRPFSTRVKAGGYTTEMKVKCAVDDSELFYLSISKGVVSFEVNSLECQEQVNKFDEFFARGPNHAQVTYALTTAASELKNLDALEIMRPWFKMQIDARRMSVKCEVLNKRPVLPQE
jgi:hypothetical protein